jgi:hypothetical protein
MTKFANTYTYINKGIKTLVEWYKSKGYGYKANQGKKKDSVSDIPNYMKHKLNIMYKNTYLIKRIHINMTTVDHKKLRIMYLIFRVLARFMSI